LKTFYLIVFVCCKIAFLQAQYSLEANYLYGKTVKHNYRFTVPVYKAAQGFEAAVLKQTNGDKSWHSLYNFPEYGIGLSHYNLGNDINLGSLTAASFLLQFNPIDKKKIKGFIRVGAGGSYVSKHYNVINNRENTAIGSGYNNFFVLKFGTKIHLTEKLLFNLMFGATHISNSRYAMPNLGANTLMINSGFTYNFYKDLEKKSLELDSMTNVKSRWQGNFRSDVVINESAAPNGPKYVSFIVNTGISKNINRKYNVYLTLETMYSKVTKYFILQSEQGRNPDLYALNIAPYLGGEMMMGKFGLNFHIGYYVFAYEKAGIIPTKIGVNYYMLKYGKNKQHSLYSSINMRSHFAIADFISLGIGTKL